tara:strand:+ start:1569 stop:2588 length:1020 start_codon:yes stop_codon:yes gene_type:complete
MTEAAQSDGTSLLSTADAVDLLLQADAPPEEDTPEVSEEPPVVEEPADAEADEVEVQAEADEAEYEEVDEVDESDDEEEEDDAPVVEEQRYRVKAGDAEAEVTLEELKNAYMRTADYTRKTQHVAEQRKEAEANLEAVLGERQRYADQLAVLEQALSQQEPTREYWDQLREDDPIEFSIQQNLARDRKDAVAQIKAEQDNVQQQHAAQLQAQAAERMEQERARMNEIIPEWLDEELAAKEKAAVVTYAQRQGYSESELSQVSDARAVSMIRKAYLYDSLMSGKTAALKKTSQAPKMTKSGQPKSGKQISNRRKQDALAKIGSQKGRNAMDAAVDFLLQK